MNRLLLLGPFPPPYGGVAIYDQALLEILRERGLDAHRRAIRVEPGPDAVPPGLAGVRSLFRETGADDVVLDSATWLLEYPVFRIAAAWFPLRRFRRFRWIKVIHDGTLPGRFHAMPAARRAIGRRAVAEADAVVVVEPGLARWVSSALGRDEGVHVIPSLLPLPPSAVPGPPQPAEDAGGKVVASVGVFTEPYGFRDLAEAVERLRGETGIPLELVLLDGGFADDPDYRRATLRGRSWIRTLPPMARAEVLRVLGSSDVFVRPSRHEAYGLCRVEALWMETPVVATNVGETRGMRTYAAGDVGALAGRILEVLRDPGARDEARTAGDRFRAEAEANLASLVRLL
ncbi:MAG: glycosyltransferase family 4 protein [Acidobacteriota bacterium]|jgi:glycosyltransferase involved in cell wall biosynthesis